MGKILPSAHGARGEDIPSQSFGTFIEGISASMRPVEAVIRELSQSDVPVLLLAETGAGKHATARRIHEMSRRSAQPFRCFQCSTVRPEDFEVVRSEAAANFGA